MTPPITLGSTLEARTSLPATIYMGDMEMPRSIRLANSAYFVAVSKDRLRFHVQLEHKWQDMSDPTRWRVWIEDDRGTRYEPIAVDRRTVKPVTTMYERGRRRSVNTQPFYSVTVYRGNGDYVFYRRDIVHDRKWLMLVMKRPGYEYRYRWQFVEDSIELRPVVADRGGKCASVDYPCVERVSPSH